MKIKFCDYIKGATTGNVFYSDDTKYYHRITKIAKKYTFTMERQHRGARIGEEVEWNNSDTDLVIY